MIRIGGQRIPGKTLVLLASDCALIILGLTLAVGLRFADLHYFHQSQVAYRFAWVDLVCLLSLYYNDLYSPDVIRHRSELFVRILQTFGVSSLALATLYYFVPSLSLGRGIAALSAPIIVIFTMGSRLLWRARSMSTLGSDRLLVMGTGAAGISLVREIMDQPDLHLKVVGFLDERGENIGISLVNPGIIGATADVARIVREESIEHVVLALKERRGHMPVRDLLNLKFRGVKVEDAHTVWERLTGRIHLEHLSPSWLILSDGFRKSHLLTFVKRGIDFGVALIGILLTAPIMLLVALAIWLESGGPIFFRQDRVGLHGVPFRILKFRSMRQDAEKNGPSWAADSDSRITRVGKFIRKVRFDELPQMFNVLGGEMSLVGPRPEQPFFCSLLEDKITLYPYRHTVRPGITGWAQIKYQYGATIEESKTKLEYDLFYIKHLSLTLDFMILFETAKVVLYGRGAK